MSRLKQTVRRGSKRKRDGTDETSDLTTKKSAKLESQNPGALENRASPNSRDIHETSTTPDARLPKKVDRRDEARKEDKSRPEMSATQPTDDIDDSIRQMDSSLLADYYAKQIKRHLGDLSTVELDGKYLPTTAFLNTSEFDESRTLLSVPSFLRQFTPGGGEELMTTVEAISSPHTLFVASSGLRAADLTRFVDLHESYIKANNIPQGPSNLSIRQCDCGKAICEAHQACAVY